MTIKNRISVISILLVGILIASVGGCKKYDEGPSVSLRSKTDRLAHTWLLDNYRVNSNDYTSVIGDYTETFSKDGGYFYSGGGSSGTGRWEFRNKNEEIWLTGVGTQSPKILYILKLEEGKFWYYYMDGNNDHEFHMFHN